MKTEDSAWFRATLKEAVSRLHEPSLNDLMKEVNSELEDLCKAHVVKFGNDKDLTGLGLELRVQDLFSQMGFEIRRGRDGLEDFVVTPPPNSEMNDPLVIEVKSSRKSTISRDELRQLDDWVFDLSGEDYARKHGLLQINQQIELIMLSGLPPRNYRHPSPHKGVMVFNGPIGTAFDLRGGQYLHPNDEEFTDKRNLCIIPFGTLIDYFDKFQIDNTVPLSMWKTIQSSSSVIKCPE